MSLLDFLRPQGAQAPGAMSQPRPSGLSMMMQPEVMAAMAGQLLGNQGNQQNFGNALSLGGIAMGKQRELQAQTAEKNKTWDWLQQNAPEFGALRDSGMSATDAMGLYAKQRYAQGKGQGYINAGAGNLFNSETGEWVSAPGGGAEGVAGLTPVWLRDRTTGEMILGQMTKDGKVLKSELPEGDYEPVAPYEKAFETNKGAKEGEAAGTAAGALPGAMATAQRVSEQVEALKTHSSLGRVLGPIDSRTPNLLPGSVDAQSRIDQLSGGAFLEARQALKGGGAITDFESQKAEKAYARLNQAAGEEEFKAALDEFNRYVQQGLQKLQAQAGMGAPRAPAYGAPTAPGGGGADPLGIR